jgi:hypothetical protein
MKSFLRVWSIFSVLLAFATGAFGQATRTWVSGVGDDANPCSRTAPCKTFAGAISKTAVGGEIDTLDPGGFGAVTITKAITIDGTAGLGGVLAAGSNGIVVNITTPVAGFNSVVVLRNLDINGVGGASAGINGVNILAATEVRVENCKIFSFGSRGINDTRTSGRLFVTDTVISNIGQTAIVALAATSSSLSLFLTRVQMDSNGNSGISVNQGARAMIAHSSASGNVNFGFFAENSVINLEDSIASWNGGSGIGAFPGSTIRISNTTVTGNGAGLTTNGSGGIFSYGFNRIAGNGSNNGPPTGSIPLQ